MFRIGLVGTGGIAIEHMRAFASLGDVEPIWVLSRLSDSSEAFAKEYGFRRAETSLEVALRDPEVNLVVVTSPSEFHAHQTIQALELGKDVIVEIPVGLSLKETEAVARCAESTGRRVLICHTMRSFPTIREVRRRVRRQELHLTHISGTFAIPRRRNQSWAGQRHWIDNLLWHHGCHQVDISLWVLDLPAVRNVRGLTGIPNRQFGMAQDVSLQFQTDAGLLVTHALTYNTEKFLWEIHFIGDEDVLIFRNGELSNEQGEVVVPAFSWLDLRVQDQEMLKAFKERTGSEYDLSSVMPAMRILEMADQSPREPV